MSKKSFTSVIGLGVRTITFCFLIGLGYSSAQAGEDIGIDRVAEMPDLPPKYQYRDWGKVARELDSYMFDFENEGEHLPVIFWSESVNSKKTFGFPSYVGSELTGKPGEQESIPVMAMILGSSLVGIDKSKQNGVNWVEMIQPYFIEEEGVYLNRLHTNSGTSFWYDLFPNILAWQIAYLYPKESYFDRTLAAVAKTTYEASVGMGLDSKKGQAPYMAWTGYSFRDAKAVDNGVWVEPDGAAGIAWIQYAAYKKFGDKRYLAGTRGALDFLESRNSNPLYELMLNYAAVVVARINAEEGDNYDLGRIINWCFGPADARPDWGILAANWNGYDVSGMQGSLTDRGGYGFAMNTFVTLSTLIPIAKYDRQYADDIGKYALNAVNSSRWFYANGLPDKNQTGYEWAKKNDPENLLTYEGVCKVYEGISPRAMGDPLLHGWAKTDFALYGAVCVGMIGGIIEQTNVDGILRIDCNKTDYYCEPTWPTYLYYNPHNKAKIIELKNVNNDKAVFDLVSEKKIKLNRSNNNTITIPAKSTMVLVEYPRNQDIIYQGNKLKAGDKLIGFKQPDKAQIALERNVKSPQNLAKVISIPKLQSKEFSIVSLDGQTSEATRLQSTKGLKVDISFSWDDTYFYSLIKEVPGDSSKKEAKSNNQYIDRNWAFDSVGLLFDLANDNERETFFDYEFWTGLSSQEKELYFARVASQVVKPRASKFSKVLSQGSFAEGNRTIAVAIAWNDMLANVPIQRLGGLATKRLVKAGFTFGCEPLLIDDHWDNRAFRNGKQIVPTGFDSCSVDLMLQD